MKPRLTCSTIRMLLLRASAMALIFTAHPCHSESITSVSSSNEDSITSKPLREKIARNFPGFDTYMVAESEEYSAVILTMPVAEDDEHKMKIAVFQRAAGQSYKLLSSSKEWKQYLRGRVGWGVRLTDQSILLDLGGSTGCCSGFETVFRFRITGNAVRLAGEETRTYGYEFSNRDVYYEHLTSINYLTGSVIHSKKSGPRKSNPEEFGFDGKPKRVEVQKSFPNTHTFELSGFHPDKHSEYKMRVPELCGYINEKMKYEPCQQKRTSGRVDR